MTTSQLVAKMFSDSALFPGASPLEGRQRMGLTKCQGQGKAQVVNCVHNSSKHERARDAVMTPTGSCFTWFFIFVPLPAWSQTFTESWLYASRCAWYWEYRCEYGHSLLEENNRFPHSVRSAETAGGLSATVGPSSVGSPLRHLLRRLAEIRRKHSNHFVPHSLGGWWEPNTQWKGYRVG